MKGQAVILYPDGARSLGAPSEVPLKVPRQRDCSDPIMPGRKVRDFSGVKAIVLAEQPDAVVAAIDAEASMVDTRMPLSSSLPWLDASKNKSAPKQQSRKKRSSRSLRLMPVKPRLNKRRKVRTPATAEGEEGRCYSG